MERSPDGSDVLTGPGAEDLLRSALSGAGGRLRSWDLDHVDHRPGRSTTALFRACVSWPDLDGPSAPAREELFGASAHVGEHETHVATPDQSLVLTNGDFNVRMWRYPHDPWLPALPKVSYPDALPTTLRDLGLNPGTSPTEAIPTEVISYRPGRRAVLRASLPTGAVFLKVVQPHKTARIVQRHGLLAEAGVPVPQVLAHGEGLVVLRELPGKPLALAVLEEGAQACRGDDLVALLDRMPRSLFSLPPHRPWTESAEFYANVVASALPTLRPRVDAVVHQIRSGLEAVDRRIGLTAHDVVHGDFYEAQIFVDRGRVVGMLDVDTVGPGRRADDLACLLAHVSVLASYGESGRISADIYSRINAALESWYRVFAARTDPQELALRTAGVLLSLATGPHRQQDENWRDATAALVELAERWAHPSTAAG
ncbi:phosphotransferase [Devriesea agamarum]|uniref:phosphotransferase n=1 Tax=Devriesea agamarum TaxID=472569 RepID=UPI00071DA35C|nr:phosphotransferase [Devriesea agamarum]